MYTCISQAYTHGGQKVLNPMELGVTDSCELLNVAAGSPQRAANVLDHFSSPY